MITDRDILYEDEECLAVAKPHGLLSEDTGGKDLPACLKEYRKSRGEPAEIYAVHRLDKVTGGAMVYAKDARAAATLSGSISERRVKKKYLAVVLGRPAEERGTLCDLLYHDKRQNKVFAVGSARKGAKEARLSYRLLATAEADGSELSLLEIELYTGRTHQIRAQLGTRRLPVLGDRRYGCRVSLTGGRIALWSHSLVFTPPSKKEPVTVVSYPRDEYPWELFSITERTEP